MKLLSGRRLGQPAPPPPRPACTPGGGADRICALPDDLLLQILARLGCAAAAARAGLLSRRWRGLWTRLPALVFRDVGLPSLERALANVISSASSDAVSLLDISLPKRASSRGPRGDVSALLRAAARLSPEQLVLALPWGAAPLYSVVELPRFARATSVSLSAASPIILRLPSNAAPDVEFPALTTLDLTGCAVDGLATLVLRCPSLRVLRLECAGSSFMGIPLDVTVHSPSLRELVLDWSIRVRRIDISAPMLEQLTVSTRHHGDLSVSVVAPKVEKVSWRCRYGGSSMGFGCWTLDAMSLSSTTTTAASEAGQRRRSSVLLCVDLSKDLFPHSLENQDHLAREVEKHLRLQVTADSSALALKLNLAPLGHVYEALVFYFLEMHPIRTAIHRLKVTMPQPETTHMDKMECKEYCGCVPDDWTGQTIVLAELEEVEIDGFQGADHEFDFLEHLFSYAPMLKRVTLKQSGEAALSDAKVQDFFKGRPCVQLCYVLSSDSTFVARG